MRLLCYDHHHHPRSPLLSCYTNNFSAGWETQESLYKIDIFSFTKISALYITLYLEAMQCSQCSQLNEHESLVPPRARKRPLWQIWGKLRNI